MLGSSDSLALVALIIAVVSLFVAVWQFAQALLTTADGYRYCQPSVVGAWSRLRYRKFHLSELRGEVRFETPFISLSDTLQPDALAVRTQAAHCLRLSSEDAEKRHLATEAGFGGLYDDARMRHPDMVSWLYLLDTLDSLQQLHLEQLGCPTASVMIPSNIAARDMHSKNIQTEKPSASPSHPFQAVTQYTPPPRISLCKITSKKWSWDLMPPDVVRPPASTDLGTIIVLGHRLGMKFQELKPSEGRIQAEGSGSSLLSSGFRGLGIVLQYTCDSSQCSPLRRMTQNLLIPVSAADKMGFGIIPSEPWMNIDVDVSLCRSTRADVGPLQVVQEMQRMGIGQNVSERYHEDHSAGLREGFGNLPGFISPWLTPSGSNLRAVIDPFRGRALPSAVSWPSNAVKWAEILKAGSAQKLSSQQQKVLAGFGYIGEIHERYRASNRDDLPEDESQRICDRLHSIHKDATEHLENFNATIGRGRLYRKLVASHITTNTQAWKSAGRPSDLKPGDTPQLFVRNLDRTRADLRSRIPRVLKDVPDQVLNDAWWTMMLRACAWYTQHILLGNYPPVPSHLYGSIAAVYIA